MAKNGQIKNELNICIDSLYGLSLSFNEYIEESKGIKSTAETSLNLMKMYDFHEYYKKIFEDIFTKLREDINLLNKFKQDSNKAIQNIINNISKLSKKEAEQNIIPLNENYFVNNRILQFINQKEESSLKEKKGQYEKEILKLKEEINNYKKKEIEFSEKINNYKIKDKEILELKEEINNYKKKEFNESKFIEFNKLEKELNISKELLNQKGQETMNILKENSQLKEQIKELKDKIEQLEKSEESSNSSNSESENKNSHNIICSSSLNVDLKDLSPEKKLEKVTELVRQLILNTITTPNNQQYIQDLNNCLNL